MFFIDYPEGRWGLIYCLYAYVSYVFELETGQIEVLITSLSDKVNKREHYMNYKPCR
jgi:hypothetical protein